MTSKEYDGIIRIMEHEKSCGTIIINQGKVLLISSTDDNGEVFWSFPKGHQEGGETDTETALRETLEEVGLQVEIIDWRPIIVGHYIHHGTARKDIHLFLAKKQSGEIKPQKNEVESWRWVEFDDIDDYLVDYYKEAWHEARRR